MLSAARTAFPQARVCAIGTSARLGGATGCEVEAMEGFAVLRACELAGVPALEVRAISNAIGELDRSRWQFDEAFDVLRAVLPALLRGARCRPRPPSKLPPPLPPEERTVAQFIGETIRAYGSDFWRLLPIGLALALADQASIRRTASGESVALTSSARRCFARAWSSWLRHRSSQQPLSGHALSS